MRFLLSICVHEREGGPPGTACGEQLGRGKVAEMSEGDIDAIVACNVKGAMLTVQAALGSLDRVEKIVKLGVFVNSAPSFTDQPKVANGASELMQDVFGEAGRHARSAVGVAVLPLGVAVEVDAIVAEASDQGWTLMFADRHPYAGGPRHYAAFLHNGDGSELEIVAPL